MEARGNKIFNIPAGQPFAKTLAQQLLQETQGQPEILTQYKILLPTRRACRILRDSFLELTGGKPLLLPQISPLGDVDEEDLSLLMFGDNQLFLDIPSAISPLKRQILLARMIMANPAFGQGLDHALRLAQDLGRFIDQVTIEGLDFSNLEKIVPEEFAAHWQITIDFLKIITHNWPAILEENNVIDGAKRRNILLHNLAQYWHQTQPQMPIIAAGTTGSIPATAHLLRIVSQLPQGRVILPGLDQYMDEESWREIKETHPQYGLKQLLEHMEVSRAQVEVLKTTGANKGPRNILATEVMRPAETTQAWKDFGNRADIPSILEGLEYYTCQTQQEEAQIIALMMRETLQQKSKIAALITPDRVLANRVSTLCQRWGIMVDDSAGQDLSGSNLGKFIPLCAHAAQKQFDAVKFLALLKNSYCGLAKENLKDLHALEIRFLRQDFLLPDFETLYQIIVESSSAAPSLQIFMKFLKEALSPLLQEQEHHKHEFSTILTRHLQVMENLAAFGQEEDSILWRGEEGEAAAAFFTELQQQASFVPSVTFADYIQILQVLMKNVTLRTPYGVHPRLLILGQLEARLTSADLIILGGLNEGTWPSDIKHDPWLSRPMRKAFGLTPAEKSISLAAHDFVQGFCAQQVVLTRSERLDGSPTVPARWLQRLDAVLKGAGLSITDLSKKPYLLWGRMMDVPEDVKSCERPAPKPPLAARPDGISITRVENWVKDPYMVYARYVLNLRKLKPLLQQEDAALRGTILHKILEEFSKAYPLELPEDAEEKLIAIAMNVMKAHLQSEEALRYWWPRFLKIAKWYIEQETIWRERAKFHDSEIAGNIDLEIEGQVFNLEGIADRIDRTQGGYAVIDYKTGGTFSQNNLKTASLPQLPLTALMVSRGGFDGKGLRRREIDPNKKRVNASPVTYLGYWKMTGGKKPGEIVCLEGDLEETINVAYEGLKTLVLAFRDENTPYYSIPDTNNPPLYNDYEHLERVKEWAALDSADEEAA